MVGNLRKKFLFVNLLFVLLLVAGCGGGSADEGDAPTSDDTDTSQNENEATEDEEESEEQEVFQVHDIQDVDFVKTEEDLKKLVTFNDDDEENYQSYTTNGNVNAGPSPFVAGEDYVLIGDRVLVDREGNGREIEDDDIGGRAESHLYGASYVDGFFYLNYDDGVYAVDETDGSMKEIGEHPPEVMKTDAENVYYISRNEDDDDEEDPEFRLRAVDQDSGEEIWKTEEQEFGFQGIGFLGVIPMEDYVIYETIDSFKALDKETGEELWELEDADRHMGIVEGDDVLFGVTVRDNNPGAFELKEYDKETGTVNYSTDLPETLMVDTPIKMNIVDDILLINMEHSILGYDINAEEPIWAVSGSDGFESDDINAKSEDTTDMEIAVTPEGAIIVDGLMNHDPMSEVEEERFIITIDPQSGEINDGYLINEPIERNVFFNEDYDYEFLISGPEEFGEEDFEAFIGTVE